MYIISSKVRNKKLIAIEGEPASGKTTLSAFLKKELDCNVVSIDDFYVAVDKRDEYSFKEGGNNIDYNRLIKNVILKHIKKEDIVYRRYDCRVNEFTDLIKLKYKPILVIEGSYCLREEVIEYYEYKILMEVDSQKQLERLESRKNYQDFIDKWIPLSRKFIEERNINNIVDEVLKT